MLRSVIIKNNTSGLIPVSLTSFICGHVTLRVTGYLPLVPTILIYVPLVHMIHIYIPMYQRHISMYRTYGAVCSCSILGSRRRAGAELQRAPGHCHQLYRVISTTMCNLLTHSSSESECSSACRPFWPVKSRCSHQNWSLVGVPAGLVLFTQAA
jgi:hypothetical protein